MNKYNIKRYLYLKILIVIITSFVFIISSQIIYSRITSNNINILQGNDFSEQVKAGTLYLEAPLYDFTIPSTSYEQYVSNADYIVHTKSQVENLANLNYVEDVQLATNDSLVNTNLRGVVVKQMNKTNITALPLSNQSYNSLQSTFTLDEYQLVSGQYPEDQSNQVMISNKLADDKNLDVGDEIKLSNTQYEISGIYEFDDREVIVAYSHKYDDMFIENNIFHEQLLFDLIGVEQDDSQLTGYGNLLVNYDQKYEQDLYEYIAINFPLSNIYSENYNYMSEHNLIINSIKSFISTTKYIMGFEIILFSLLIIYKNVVKKESRKLHYINYSKQEIKKINFTEVLGLLLVINVLATLGLKVLYPFVNLITLVVTNFVYILLNFLLYKIISKEINYD